mgnify:CR=1 FL=1
MQEIIIGILFVGAIFFMGRYLWKQYKADSGCASSGCDACVPSDEANKKIKLPGHFSS